MAPTDAEMSKWITTCLDRRQRIERLIAAIEAGGSKIGEAELKLRLLKRAMYSVYLDMNAIHEKLAGH